jgi:hypothetical protein
LKHLLALLLCRGTPVFPATEEGEARHRFSLIHPEIITIIINSDASRLLHGDGGSCIPRVGEMRLLTAA